MTKLTVELVPKTCHYSNVRTMVTTKEWDVIRHLVYDKADNKCEICGDVGTNQGYKHRVECHEVWQYDESDYTQRLVGLVALCPTCHQVKHIGRARAIGKIYECYKQLSKINHWTKEMIEKHISEANEEYSVRSKVEWSLDISLLNKKPYELNLDLTKERIFEMANRPKVKDRRIQEMKDNQLKLKLKYAEPNKTKKIKKDVKKVTKKHKLKDTSHLTVVFKDKPKKPKKTKKNINRKPPKK